jgi:hypothetical protein
MLFVCPASRNIESIVFLAESNTIQYNIPIHLSGKDIDPFYHRKSHKMNSCLVPYLIPTLIHAFTQLPAKNIATL